MAFGVVYLFKIGIVGCGLNALLRWDDLIVASHYRNHSEFETFREMHGNSWNVPVFNFDILAEHPDIQTGARDGILCAIEFG